MGDGCVMVLGYNWDTKHPCPKCFYYVKSIHVLCLLIISRI